MDTHAYEAGPAIADRPELQELFSPYVPFYQENVTYTTVLKPFAYPYEFSGWKDEQLSWKLTCYLHGGLNPSPLCRFSGPDAVAFLSHYCVNTFDRFPVGSGKHCITCDADGLITSDGVIIRNAEDSFDTYWMWSLAIHAQMDAGKWDMQVEDHTNDMFLFQLGGPESLKVLEAVTGEAQGDIRFMRVKHVRICGFDVRVIRLGMAGSLAYELHGDLANAREIYDAIYQAGKPFGIRRLGWHAYMMQHTENGFPQFGDHFMMKLPGAPSYKGMVAGSIGPEADGYANPFELNWGSCVKFDHDFVGREALERIAADPKRKTVSLEWNRDDVAEIWASRFDEEPYAPMDTPNDMQYVGMGTVLHQDKVLDAGGNEVGYSAGRGFTVYYHAMISIAVVDVEHATIGEELTVVWGEPGTRQKLVRAKVARFPYYDENRNQTFVTEA